MKNLKGPLMATILASSMLTSCKKEKMEKETSTPTELEAINKFELLEGNDPDPGIVLLNEKYASDSVFRKRTNLERINKKNLSFEKSKQL